MREIGSEFSVEYINERNKTGIPGLDKGQMVFSGRTAIETVLLNESSIHNALLPSYCCDSMIEPFRKAGVNVNFYSVNYVGGISIGLELNEEVDCILWCNYFGFSVPMPDFSDFIHRGGVVIEDITHSLYSEKQSHDQSHYLVASLRKWEAVLCGGYCASRKGILGLFPQGIPFESFLKLKKKAMDLKRRYLLGENDIAKSEFLQIYSEANEWLAENYSGLDIDDYSRNYLAHVDFTSHREQRVRNAQVLYEGLNGNPDIQFMFPINKMDCPLFVPVLIRNGKRDQVRKKLIDREIYCPVHWPHPDDICESNLYDMELSLICDHRYSEEDMKRIVEVLNNEI